MTSRDATLDVAKALAIVAIVFGHVWRGLNSAGMISNDVLFRTVDTSVYMWHLSVFAFTAGLFVQRGMRREGPWRYAANRDLTFLWLYVLWSLIQGSVKLLAGAFVNSQTSVLEILQIWIPDSQLWFLGWIALMMILAAATQPWGSTVRMIVTLVIAAIGSVLMWGLNGPFIGTQGLALSVNFVVALVWRGDRLLAVLQSTPLWLDAIFVLVAGGLSQALVLLELATPPTVGGEERTIPSIAMGVVASTLGVLTVLYLSHLLAQTLVRRPLAYVGQRSMVIFLAHITFASGTRIFLSLLGIDDWGIQATLGTITGVLGPLTLHWFASRIGLRWLFDTPRWLEHPLQSRRAPSSPR